MNFKPRAFVSQVGKRWRFGFFWVFLLSALASSVAFASRLAHCWWHSVCFVNNDLDHDCI